MNFRWFTRLKLLRISKIVIPVCLATSVTFAGFSIYGSRVGNFVVNVEDEPEGCLALSEDEDPFAEDATLAERLSTPALKKQVDATYSWIPYNIAQGMGSKNAENYTYFAYSYYLVNTDADTIDYQMTATLNEMTGESDEIVRFMLIKGEQYTYGVDTEYPADPDKSQGVIYAKAESDENKAYVKENAGYDQVDFVSDTLVYSIDDSIDGSSCIKYTIVMWIEGWDVDCTDDKIGGTIKMQMDISQVG